VLCCGVFSFVEMIPGIASLYCKLEYDVCLKDCCNLKFAQ
jgi:hypothetical protein